jgi:hypothetical protein
MAAADLSVVRSKPIRIWFIIGVALLAYAVLGNWLVLPGYRRFLKHGSPNASGTGVDFALIWGATRTILWMFSFHLGALCLAYTALAARGEAVRSFSRWFVAGALLWIVLWAIPELPGPYTAFFATVGILILAMIVFVFVQAAANATLHGSWFGEPRGGEWQIASCFFFALATWDMCGLGSVGGILHPSDEVRAASQSLVVAQTTKLIVELAIAWGLLAIAVFSRKVVRGG